MLIQPENTPNPDAMKFALGMEVSPLNPRYFTNAEQSGINFLAKKILGIDGIKAIFFGDDFITVTKEKERDWVALKPEIINTITQHINSGLGILEHGEGEGKEDDVNTTNLSRENVENTKNKQTTISDNERTRTDEEIIAQIKDVIATKIRPAVAMDGGDVVFKQFNNGKVIVTLQGACSGCPSSMITLEHGIRSTLQHYIPEVKEVETDEDDEEALPLH